MTASRALPDQAARLAALGKLQRSMLVEASAGSGKTAIMAGRVAMLFAEGVEPKRVAAITFTEFAAAELMIRITRFVAKLAKGEVPYELEIAFPHGVSDKQKANFARADKSLDQLLCSTIHGFAQALIKPYPVEARIDPGAEIVDPSEADLAFDEHYDAWLREHLSGETDDDVVAECVLADENDALKDLQKIAVFRRRNRDARPAPVTWTPGLIEEFVEAVTSFRAALSGLPFREEDTSARAEDFAALAEAVSSSLLHSDRPTNWALIQVLTSTQPQSCFTQAGCARKLQTKTKWQTVAAATAASKAKGTEAYDIANANYVACHDAFEKLTVTAAGVLLARLSAAMDGLIQDWRSYKRAAALLDFDDLLYTARDLLAHHEPVRRALANRFQYVLVDEFQDTDPLQIEILWWLCGEAQSKDDPDPCARTLRPGALFLVGDPVDAGVKAGHGGGAKPGHFSAGAGLDAAFRKRG
jgi:ATP-dependent exoDNAse (exonuclease V) beta subunit